jgi:hypothetical protein
LTDRTPIIAPGTLPGRARATRKAHDRRTRLARESRAANPAGRARPETASRDEYRVLRSKPSNISLTPQSTRLDLPLVPPRQRPGHTQQHIHRQRRLTEHPPYQIRSLSTRRALLTSILSVRRLPPRAPTPRARPQARVRRSGRGRYLELMRGVRTRAVRRRTGQVQCVDGRVGATSRGHRSLNTRLRGEYESAGTGQCHRSRTRPARVGPRTLREDPARTPAGDEQSVPG